MGKSEKQMDKEQGRNQRIIDTAFRLFVEKKIEAVSMDEVAKEAGVGRATLFRCYNNKTELAIAVCASKWKAYLGKTNLFDTRYSGHRKIYFYAGQLYRHVSEP